MKKLFLIVNPVAGKMKVKGALFEIIHAFCQADYAVSVAMTQYRGHAAALACEAAQNGTDLVVCAGGDGTLNEVITGLLPLDAPPPIGYIPCGSTNDFANSMKLSTDPKKAAEQILSGEASCFDIGCFNGKRYFSYIASFGAFTEASYATPQELKNMLGHFAYVLEGVKGIGNIRPYHVSVTGDDGVSAEGDYLFGGVANSTSIAGIFKLRQEDVDTDDGKFEVILVKKPKNAGEWNELIGAVLSANLQSPMLDYFKTSALTVRSEEEITWTLDGEEEKGGTESAIANIHRRIRIVR